MSASGLYCKKLGVASRLHMYLTDSKLNLPVQTARKLVLAPSPFDDYLEMNPTRRSRIYVHRVSAINKPKNTLRPDNPGGGGVRGRREGGETIEAQGCKHSPPNSVSRVSSPAGDAICVLRCLVVGSRSFSEKFFPGDSGFPLKCMSVMGCGNGWGGYLALDLRVSFVPIPAG